MSDIRQTTRFWISGLVALALLMTSGCASRRFVRNEVEASSDALSGRIQENEADIDTARLDIDLASGRVEAQSSRLDETGERLDDAQREIDATRSEVAEVRDLAEDALVMAGTASERTAALENLFGSRNRYQMLATHELYFDFDSAALRSDTSTELEAVAGTIEDNPDLTIVLEGRTDSTGEADYNIELGERRIDAVRRFLVVQLGVAVYRIHSFSFGEAEPLFSNTDTGNRQRNRAVMLSIWARGRTQGAGNASATFSED